MTWLIRTFFKMSTVQHTIMLLRNEMKAARLKSCGPASGRTKDRLRGIRRCRKAIRLLGLHDEDPYLKHLCLEEPLVMAAILEGKNKERQSDPSPVSPPVITVGATVSDPSPSPVSPPAITVGASPDLLSTAMIDSGISSDASSSDADDIFAEIEDWLKSVQP